MKEMLMVTKENAVELVKLHADLCKEDPADRSIYDSAIVQALGKALLNHRIAPDVVAYIIENIFDEQDHEEALEFLGNPMLTMLEMIVRVLYKEEEDR